MEWKRFKTSLALQRVGVVGASKLAAVTALAVSGAAAVAGAFGTSVAANVGLGVVNYFVRSETLKNVRDLVKQGQHYFIDHDTQMMFTAGGIKALIHGATALSGITDVKDAVVDGVTGLYHVGMATKDIFTVGGCSVMGGVSKVVETADNYINRDLYACNGIATGGKKIIHTEEDFLTEEHIIEEANIKKLIDDHNETLAGLENFLPQKNLDNTTENAVKKGVVAYLDKALKDHAESLAQKQDALEKDIELASGWTVIHQETNTERFERESEDVRFKLDLTQSLSFTTPYMDLDIMGMDMEGDALSSSVIGVVHVPDEVA